MHFEDAGDGPVILLLHAFPIDGRMWGDQVRDLQMLYRVIVPDMPGFGTSQRPEGNPSLEDWAKSVVAACKAKGIEHALVAGCSMGGYLMFAMQRVAPGFAVGMALVNTRASADTQDGRRARYEMVERARHEGTAFLAATEPPVSPRTAADHPEIVAAIRAMMADATPVGVMAAQRAMASRKDSRPLLASIRLPVTIVHGLDDPIIKRDDAESMASAIPGAVYVPVPDAGHLSPIEKPSVVTAAIRALAARTFQKT